MSPLEGFSTEDSTAHDRMAVEGLCGASALVTGAAGFIGSHLCGALLAAGVDVLAVDDLTAGRWANLEAAQQAACDRSVAEQPADDPTTNTRPGSLRRLEASILDESAMDEACTGHRWVFHLAALGSVPQSLQQPERYEQVNALGTLRLLRAAQRAGVHRVVYSGSCSAYGDPPEPSQIHEDLPPRPQSPYAASKLAGELYAQAFSAGDGLDTAILRYFNVFGPRQSAESAYAAVVAAFAKRLLTGEPVTIFGDGEQTRDFTHVSNAVRANLLAATHLSPLHGTPFNVGTGVATSINELYRLMAQLAGRPDTQPTYGPARPGEVRHSRADLSRTRRVLGYEPQTPLRQGLEETLDWYRQTV